MTIRVLAMSSGGAVIEAEGLTEDPRNRDPNAPYLIFHGAGKRSALVIQKTHLFALQYEREDEDGRDAQPEVLPLPVHRLSDYFGSRGLRQNVANN